MRIASLILAVASGAAWPFFTVQDPERPQDPKNDQAYELPSPEDQQAMFQRWQEVCTPGKRHEALQRFLGEWESELAIFMMPGAPPMTSKGKARGTWLAEGRWLRFESEGNVMGQENRGFTMIGYDNYKQKYVSAQVDSTTTALLSAEGNFDQTGDLLMMFGLMDEPMTGEHDKLVKYQWRFLDADHIVLEVHDLPIGETKTKVVEVKYSRVTKG